MRCNRKFADAAIQAPEFLANMTGKVTEQSGIYGNVKVKNAGIVRRIWVDKNREIGENTV